MLVWVRSREEARGEGECEGLPAITGCDGCGGGEKGVWWRLLVELIHRLALRDHEHGHLPVVLHGKFTHSPDHRLLVGLEHHPHVARGRLPRAAASREEERHLVAQPLPLLRNFNTAYLAKVFSQDYDV